MMGNVLEVKDYLGIGKTIRKVIKNVKRRKTQKTKLADSLKIANITKHDNVQEIKQDSSQSQDKVKHAADDTALENVKEDAKGKVENALEESSDDEADVFREVRQTIDLKSLRILAVKLRHQWEEKSNSSLATSGVDCQINPETLNGSFNLLYQIEFDDNIRWLLKVPANGYKDGFDKLSANSLRAEALTMRLIKRKTTIPVPEVYGFDDSCENIIACPYIMMEYITGSPLHDVWFNRDDGPEILEQRRSRALHEIANAIIQLNQFTFFRGGTVLYDENGDPSGDVGPFRMLDTIASFRKLNNDEGPSGCPYTFQEVQPVSDAKGFLTCMLQKRAPPKDQYCTGIELLFQFFIDNAVLVNHSLVKNLLAGEKNQNRFVLTHPDFDIQNFIVSEDGGLRGVIDWDGVIATPRGMAGNEKYPRWLTYDWDEMAYRYDEDSPHSCVDSAGVLSKYRKLYQKIIEELSGSDLALLMTRRTLVYNNLVAAAHSPVPAAYILDRIFHEAVAKSSQGLESQQGEDDADYDSETADENPSENEEIGFSNEGCDEDLQFYPVCMDLGEGILSDVHEDRLKRGFRAILDDEQ